MKKIIYTTFLFFNSILFASNPSVGIIADMGLGIGAQFNNNTNVFIGNYGLSADYLYWHDKDIPDIDPEFTWYAGAGISYSFGDNKNQNSDIRMRVPLGLDWNFHKRVDGFLEIIPFFKIKDEFRIGVTTALGVRYQF